MQSHNTNLVIFWPMTSRWLVLCACAVLAHSADGRDFRRDKELGQQSGGAFQCPSEGFHPDAKDCKVFYRCVEGGSDGQTQLTAFQFECGPGTVFDTENKICIHAGDSPKAECRALAPPTDPEPEPSPGDISNELPPEDSLGGSAGPEAPGVQSPYVENPQPIVPNEPVSGIPGGQPDYPDYDSGDGENDDNNNDEGNNNDDSSDEGMVESPSCSGEGFFGVKGSCRQFYRCVTDGENGFIKYDFQCGQGSVWDEVTGSCNHPSATDRDDCKPKSFGNGGTQQGPIGGMAQPAGEYTPSTEEPDTAFVLDSEEESSSSDCSSEGFKEVEGNCEKFIRCVPNGQGGLTKLVYDCAEGTVWDQTQETCNHPNLVHREDCGLTTPRAPLSDSTLDDQTITQTWSNSTSSSSSQSASSSSSWNTTSTTSNNNNGQTTSSAGGSQTSMQSGSSQSSSTSGGSTTTTSGSESGSSSSQNQQGSSSGSNQQTTSSGSNQQSSSSGSNTQTTSAGSNQQSSSSGSNTQTTESGSNQQSSSGSRTQK